ncbi:nuclear transport factor 2 family protein [Luteolibacter sp. Populi]|uniref:nuclear transport factor 2 family protein n=1 Tax=Luteolibacter sp. Populi TaxID=3230487 RepID=UPI0034673DB2
MNPTDLARACFTAYDSRDREAMEHLLADDFTFSSPLDDRISRDRYFERCWPNDTGKQQRHILRTFAEGNEVFVTYECSRSDGSRFRNTEFFRIQDDRIKHVDVYFGSDDPSKVSASELRSIMAESVAACRAKDANALVARHAAQVMAFDVVDPLRYRGADAVEERTRQWLDSFSGPIGYELLDLVVVAGGDAGFCHSLNHVNGTKTDGSRISMWWRATVCFRKIGGEWKATHLHSSVPFDPETGLASIGLEP